MAVIKKVSIRVILVFCLVFSKYLPGFYIGLCLLPVFSDVIMKIGSIVAIVIAAVVILAGGMIYFVYGPMTSDVVDVDIPSDDDELVPLGNMTFEDAVKCQKVLDAVEKSASTRKWEKVK